MNALSVSVGYDDYLALTLPHNLVHFDAMLVVTTSQDQATQALVEKWSETHDVEHYATDAFHKDGAPFNKGLAIEEGFEALGREGWIMLLDADTVLPEVLSPPAEGWREDSLYSPQRRLCDDPGWFTPELEWDTLPYGNEKGIFPFEFAGYCQLFHASAPNLKTLPWYPGSFPTAQACDSWFYERWPKRKRVRPPFEVLHLGPTRENWKGRVTPRAGE